MREHVRIRMSSEQLTALGIAMAGMPEGETKKIISGLVYDATTSFEEDPGDLIEEARRQYIDDDHDIDIDDDAALSETDNGTWVGAWVWIPREDDEDEEDEDQED